MSTRTMIAATALMGTLVAPARAQQHQHGQQGGDGAMAACPMMQAMHGQMTDGMGQMGMEGMQGQTMGSGMMGMMGAMWPGPQAILDASETLQLTPVQTGQIESLQGRFRTEHEQHVQAATSACENASRALEGDAPDLDAYAAALNEAADHMVGAHVEMIRAALQARELLTPEQRGKLGDMGGRGGMMQGGG